MKVQLIVVLTLAATICNIPCHTAPYRHFLYLLNLFQKAGGVCLFHIKDIDVNMMFLKDGQLLQPIKGILVLQPGDQMMVTCALNLGFRMPVTCIAGKQFQTLDHQIININQLKCLMNTTPRKINTCLGRKSLIQIGFQNGNSIMEQIEVCFDDRTKQTHYAKMTLAKEIDDYESETIRRGDFKRDGTFIKDSLAELYRKQELTFHKLLGKRLNGRVNEGQLVASADFSYSAQRRLTMFYLNTAPQWTAFNTGNWRQLELRIRSTVKNNDYDVYTGTYGILELQDTNNNTHRMYLDAKNEKYPVPKYFWKVLVEKTSQPKKGIAFIGSNNVIDACEETLCTDKINSINWLTSYPHWKSYKKGRIIACEVEDFKTLWQDQLPNFPAIPAGLPINSL